MVGGGDEEAAPKTPPPLAPSNIRDDILDGREYKGREATPSVVPHDILSGTSNSKGKFCCCKGAERRGVSTPEV
jgi:hypothetical protein